MYSQEFNCFSSSVPAGEGESEGNHAPVLPFWRIGSGAYLLSRWNVNIPDLPFLMK